uniref:Secreted protein n=1 Tax=Rhizophora mucronata TaxID=61149 RepID=A0A2P2NUA1_RHIMU
MRSAAIFVFSLLLKRLIIGVAFLLAPQKSFGTEISQRFVSFCIYCPDDSNRQFFVHANLHVF